MSTVGALLVDLMKSERNTSFVFIRTVIIIIIITTRYNTHLNNKDEQVNIKPRSSAIAVVDHLHSDLP